MPKFFLTRSHFFSTLCHDRLPQSLKSLLDLKISTPSSLLWMVKHVAVTYYPRSLIESVQQKAAESREVQKKYFERYAAIIVAVSGGVQKCRKTSSDEQRWFEV